MNPRKTLLAAVAAAALLVTGTACDDADGGGNGDSGAGQGTTADGGLDRDLSGAEVAALALSATQELDSLTMRGEIAQPTGTIEMALSATTAGACEGTLLGEGMDVEFVSVDGATYVRQPPEAWAAQGVDAAEAEALIGNSWIRSDEEGVDAFCAVENMLDDMAPDGAVDAEIEIIGEREVGGYPTVVLAEEGEDGVVHVLDDSETPYIVLLDDGAEFEIAFSDFNEDFAIEAPPADEVVNPTDLGIG